MKKTFSLLLSIMLLVCSALPGVAETTTTNTFRTWDDLTAQEQKQVEKVQYIDWCYFYYEPSLNQNVVYFGFMDDDVDYCNVAAPAIVTIRIEDDYGTELHSQTTETTLQDFSRGDKYRFDEGRNMLACIPVNYTGENPELWHVFLYVKQYGYYFEEFEIINNYLKLNLFTIRDLRDPTEIGSLHFSDVRYRYSTNGRLDVFFTGEVNNYGSGYYGNGVPLYLYDNEGYSIDDSDLIIRYNGYGHKFRDEDITFWVAPGVYSLDYR